MTMKMSMNVVFCVMIVIDCGFQPGQVGPV
jgi:hypothetical protein